MNKLVFPPTSFEQFNALLQHALSPFTVAELVLAIAFVTIALLAPHWGNRAFEGVERRLSGFPLTPGRQVLLVGFAAVLARGLLLPWLGVPVPYVHDENSILLQAQTYAAGRLVNPTHPFWEHFETFYVNQVPAYASMYFPGRGAPPALGLLVADNAWVGVWASVVLMCMAATWMLQGWVSPAMALLGGLVVVARFGVFSFWVNSYYGGAFAAAGAMLVVGALPRILKAPGWGNGLAIGAGAAILLVTRPYEGALLCFPVSIAILVAAARRRGWKAYWPAFMKMAAPALVVLTAGGALMVTVNAASTGDPLKTAYSLNREYYATAPAFLVAAPIASQERGPSHVREFFSEEGSPYARRTSPVQLLFGALSKVYHTWAFYIGPTFLIAFLAGLLLVRRQLFLPAALAFFFAGYFLQTWNFPQYTAPIFPVLLVLVMRGIEHLRTRGLAGEPRALFLSRAMPAAAFALFGVAAVSLVAGQQKLPPTTVHSVCCSTGGYDDLRPRLKQQLVASPGRDLVLVKGGPHNPINYELVNNAADIDSAEIVWAHSLGPEKDARLRRYFADRSVWELEWVSRSERRFRLRRVS